MESVSEEFIFGYNALSAVFRGLGNSAAPLLFVGIACVVNVFGDLLLVVVGRRGRPPLLAGLAVRGHHRRRHAEWFHV